MPDRDVPLPVLVALVAAGGAAGGAARAGLGELLGPVGTVPVATLAANLLGCLCLGLLLGAGSGPRSRALLGTGLLGGFTTWSALALETDRLLASAPLVAAAYLVGSCAGGLLLAAAGLRLGQAARRAGGAPGGPGGTVLLVALGTAAGAVLRLLVGRAVAGPRGTLAVNLAGSLLLGLLAGTLTGPALVLLGTGLAGGLTTFGTWSAEVVQGQAGPGNALLTVAGCLLACAAGLGLSW